MTILASLHRAHQIAFAPFIFQAVVASLQLGLLPGIVYEKRTRAQWAEKLHLTPYAVGVLVDILLARHIITEDDDGVLQSTQLADLFVLDEMTRANFEFTEKVNYEALSHTTEALRDGKPAGLQVFNPNWKTIYPHLTSLPAEARDAWYRFDHFHSDHAYEAALAILSGYQPRHLVDIGANTGRFTRAFLAKDKRRQATFVDLPEQIAAAKVNPELSDVCDRIHWQAINWLDDVPLRAIEGADWFWMSQFLDCFSRDEVVSILRRVRKVMPSGARLAVLEPIVDRQRHEAAQLSLAVTNLYFTVLANGNSRFFSGATLRALFAKAGFTITQEIPHLGISHTLFLLEPKRA